jgi:DNA-binding transcriptional MerR regulator
MDSVAAGLTSTELTSTELAGTGLISIGEFARWSRLSRKALRLYDRLGLLRPARVDPDSGYRWYAASQLEQARLIAGLRELGLPLAEIGPILALDGPTAADRLDRYWSDAEAGHHGRRELALSLLNRLHGKETTMTAATPSATYGVGLRDLPDRQVLCLQRHLHASEMLTVGRQFVKQFWGGTVPALDGVGAVPALDGVAGAAFVIFYGHVSEDSDGPVEWCRPVPADQAAELAAQFPELTLRTDPAHQEAFVHLPSAAEAGEQWLPVMQAMEAWGEAHHRQPAGGIRQLLIWPRTSPGYGPELEFAVPLVPGEFR